MKRYYDLNRIYKDSIRKKLTGVCAGAARYFNIEVWIVRLATVLAFIALPMPVAVAYLLATVLLPTR